ncbi:MAG: hypothetical protein M3454_13760 [Actinomycetota bacterium]|nr:hypothetical protein [Actinomycetota bacterium]
MDEGAGGDPLSSHSRPSVTVAFLDGNADTVTGDDPQVRRACALARSFVGASPPRPLVTLILDDGRTVPVSDRTALERRIRGLARRII